ncbi:hypothetical protein ACIBG5_05050 [Kribbella sp. NPDC050241]|uniref:hypothetical protein n=1 Tax=Kribbella sp. NPDC050241 TaxID=3364115 RepID=UPI00379F79C9
MTESLGRFVSNVIEFVISGVLFLATLAVLFQLSFPGDSHTAWERFEQLSSKTSSDTLLFAMGVAFAYAAGAFAENLARWLFEWRLNQIKVQRSSDQDEYGNMRFAIMARHPELYLEIEFQLKRMRTERVLALCLALLLPAAASRLIVDPRWFWVICFVMLIGGLLALLTQINERFHRYCRAIERAYHESTKVPQVP